MGSHLTFPGCNVGIARGSRKCLLAIIAMLPLHRRGRRWEDHVSWAARRSLERLFRISHKIFVHKDVDFAVLPVTASSAPRPEGVFTGRTRNCRTSPSSSGCAVAACGSSPCNRALSWLCALLGYLELRCCLCRLPQCIGRHRCTIKIEDLARLGA